MALEREALTHKIEDDLALRNRNWNQLDSHLAETAADDVHGLKSALDKKFDIGEYPQNSTYGYLSYSGDVDLL